MFEKFTVSVDVNKDIESCFKMLFSPEHFKQWRFNASDDWEVIKVSSEFKVGGRFSNYLQAKDQSVGREITVTYDIIETPTLIRFHFDDNRVLETNFKNLGNQTNITLLFDAEKVTPIDVQQRVWQSMLNNFKEYVESI